MQCGLDKKSPIQGFQLQRKCCQFQSSPANPGSLRAKTCGPSSRCRASPKSVPGTAPPCTRAKEIPGATIATCRRTPISARRPGTFRARGAKIGSASSGRQGDYLVQSMSGTGRRSGQTNIPRGESNSLYVHSTPSIDNTAVTLDDKRERRSRISPVFSSGPSWLHRAMCFMVNGPENSCIRAGRFFESVAVSSHSPR